MSRRKLIIGTDGEGVKEYQPQQEIIVDSEINAGPFDFSKSKVHSLIEDKDQNLWLGIFQKGLITSPYPGIPALLDALKAEGIQCAVFSNKADALCGGIIAHYFGTSRFDAVRGNRPGVPTKPDPTGLYALMAELGADPTTTLFVGDSDVDILTGHNAQLPAMGALWGFRGRAELTAAGADALAEVPEDILRYVQEQNK